MTRSYHDHMTGGALVCEPLGDCDIRHSNFECGYSAGTSLMGFCEICKTNKRRPDGTCHGCETINRIKCECFDERESSPEMADVFEAVAFREDPGTKHYRYPKPRTLAQKQAHAARARAAKGRTAV